jgi:hypothetical protein
MIKEDRMNEKLIAKRVVGLLFGMLLLSLAACSGASQPQLIAAYPSQPESKGQAMAREQFVYDAYMEMEVWDPDAAAERERRNAYDCGGYLVSSGGHRLGKHIQLVLAAPPQLKPCQACG